tara:strand:+ start:23 stop:202 length:180 start_codon:yes stop_codon:yes gene_type:complete
MREGIYIFCLIAIVVFVGLIAGNVNKKTKIDMPIEHTDIEDEFILEEKVYEKYEMGNYR